MRLVIDTNIWISLLLGRTHEHFVQSLVNHSFVLVTCAEQVQELRSVLSRPKLRRYFGPEDAAEAMSLFLRVSELVEIHSKIEDCRDPKDNFLLASAFDGHADFLVTGDQDLLCLHPWRSIGIISLRDLERLT